MIPPIFFTPRAWAALAVVVVLAGLIANTYRLSAAVDSARAELVTTKADLQTCRGSNERLTASLDAQNKAVDQFAVEATAARQRAQDALAKVAEQERARAVVQAKLETFQRRAGETDCDAARRMLLEYPR